MPCMGISSSIYKREKMDRTPASCAMEWSIELEKGLRSKTPGKRIEAILRIGPRLAWWNRESKVTVAQYKFFGLVPDEDKLFANAILLRLADAFRTGDKPTKTSIVMIFLQEWKSRRKRSHSVEKGEEGIFSKQKLENYLEILRRVKVVFDEGDVEERALALYLFGCWADFAKNSADIRYVILSSTVSDDAIEVKASLFAARCFCELATDFGSVLLEILSNRLTSIETSMAFKLAAARAFASMWCSFLLASRAYKTGLKLILDSSEESFSAAMLISLTKLASRWSPLIPQQIELLFSLLAKYRAMHMQVTTLKCLQFVFARGVGPCPEARDMIQNLFDIQNQSKASPALLHEVLKVLHKIISCNLPTFPSSEILEVFSMLLKFVENIIQFSIMSERLLAIWVLIDILGKFLGRPKLESDEMASALTVQVISLVIDQICVPMKSYVGTHPFLVNTGDHRITKTLLLSNILQSNEELKTDVTSLVKPILYLVENHSDVSNLVLDKVNGFLEHLVDILHKDVITEKEELLNSEILKCGEEDKIPDFLKLVIFLTKIMNTCLENLEVENAKVIEVLNSFKLLVDYVRKSIPFDSYTYGIYVLLLHCHSAYKSIWQEMNQIKYLGDTYSLSYGDSFLQHDTLIVECTKKMLERRDNWSSYKAGKHAACQGLWSSAALIFEQLTKMVISDSNYVYLKTLVLFSHSESQIEYFGLVNVKECLSEEYEFIAKKNNVRNYGDILVRAYNGVCLAEKTLRTATHGPAFTFQRWFLALRAKVLEIVVDITALLGPISFVQESSDSGRKKIIVPVPSLISLEKYSFFVDSLTLISFRLKKLADEFDLLATSFIGMDRRSMKIISSLATSCSLLAFVTGLALSFPFSHISANNITCSLESSDEKFHAVLIQDLLERLWLTDSETSKDLWMLLKGYRKSESCFWPKSQIQTTSISYQASAVVKLCKDAVVEVIGHQDEANILCSDESRSQVVNNGLQWLLRIVWKWMQIPFKCPKRLFQERHNVLSELFAMNEDGENVDGTAVSLGSQLSLNLCLQLKNMHPSLSVIPSKFYCILSCTAQPQNRENKERAWLSNEEWEIDDVLDLNKRLVRYVTGSTPPNGIDIRKNDGSCWAKDEYVCFHPNERGEGFSTCLLDISDFPAGNYRINWHSCCVDDEGSYWSLLPLNAGPNFTIEKPFTSRSTRLEVP